MRGPVAEILSFWATTGTERQPTRRHASCISAKLHGAKAGNWQLCGDALQALRPDERRDGDGQAGSGGQGTALPDSLSSKLWASCKLFTRSHKIPSTRTRV